LRSPIWYLVSQALVSSSIRSDDGPLSQVQGPALTVSDQRLFAELFTRWARRGFPDDYLIAFSLRDLLGVLGLSAGGSGAHAVRSALQRLISATFVEVSRDPADRTHIAEIGANLVTHYEATTRPDAPWCARLNSKTMEILLRKPLTYLDAPTWDALLQRDALAARLWVWLEGEQVTTEWRWSVFQSSHDSRVAALRPRRGSNSQAPVARLLRLDTWSRRAKVLHRLRLACRILTAIDDRYQLAVEPSVTDKGNYVLRCRRAVGGPRFGRADASTEHAPEGQFTGTDQPAFVSGPPSPSAAGTPGDTVRLGPLVMAAWASVSPNRRLSAHQRAVLRDFCAQFGDAKIGSAIHAAAGAADPFSSLMRIVMEWRRSEIDDWNQAKLQESAAGPSALRDILARATVEAPGWTP